MAQATFDTTTRQLIITDDDGRRLAASLDVPEGQTLADELTVLNMAPGAAGWQTSATDRRHWWCYVTPPPPPADVPGVQRLTPESIAHARAALDPGWEKITGTELLGLLTRFAARADVAAAIACGADSEANLTDVAQRFLVARGFLR